MGNVIDDMYNVPDIEAKRDQALTEKARQGSKMIWVTFRKEGLHKYPAALDDPKLACLLYTSPSPRDATLSRMPSSA